MGENKDSRSKLIGILFGVGAYILWGILTIYWKQLGSVSALEVLAHRILWCAVFMLIFVVVTGRFHILANACIDLWRDKSRLWRLVAATCFVNLNWFLFIWAVLHDQVVASSLGYYINPLVNVLLGAIFLRERLNKWQYIAFGLSFIGVVIVTVGVGSLPIVAVLLPLSFGMYGLLKKKVNIDAVSSLTIESTLSSIFALTILIFYVPAGQAAFNLGDIRTSLLLIGAGVATAVPLLFFGVAVVRLPLFWIGFLQYISPTITLLLGVLLYKEPFSVVQLAAFIFIWLGVLVFSFSGVLTAKKEQRKIKIN